VVSRKGISRDCIFEITALLSADPGMKPMPRREALLMPVKFVQAISTRWATPKMRLMKFVTGTLLVTDELSATHTRRFDTSVVAAIQKVRASWLVTLT